jgi:hypothetical protein
LTARRETSEDRGRIFPVMEQQLNRPLPIAGTKLILGLFFTILGVMWTADNLRLLRADDFLRYWPAVVVLIGVINLADPARRLFGAILTVVGASLLAYSAGWLRFTIFDFWPLLLIILGAAIVGRALGVRLPGAAATDSSDVWAVLTTRKINNASRDFAGARVTAFMGGCELDLTDADIFHSPAVIDVFAMWGGIEIYVPDRFEVIGEVVPFMAGFEMQAAPAGDPNRRLVIRGAAFMGGIEVKRRAA